MNQATPQHAAHTPDPSRRRIAAALAAATVAATLAGTVPDATPAEAATTKACTTTDFRDVAKTSSFYESITWLRCEGISTGYANGTYTPGRHLTRGEAAQLLYRYSRDTHQPGTKQDFSDVATSHSAFTAVSWMKDKGHTQGYANGTFGADRPISRGELAAVLYRMSGERASTSGRSPFIDMSATETFRAPAAWLQDTGLVSGYTDKTFRPGRAVTRGETATFLYAVESHVNGAPPTYKTPVRTGAVVNATGGSSGTYRDAKSLSYSNGVSTSQYHLYADHLDGKKPHGIVVFLHGDGADEYIDPEGTMIAAYVELARKHDLMLVVPRTPDRSGSHTWWEGTASSQYAADLLQDLGKKYNVDLNQVYWTGYSGGADTIAEKMLAVHSAGWTGGAAVIVAGGGFWDQPTRPIPAALKENFQMHWVVGSQDTPAAGGTGDDGYDALRSAKNGHAHYTGQGMDTTLTVVPGLDHLTIAPHGPATLARVLADR